MAGKDLDITSGGVQLHVEGLSKTLRALKRAGVDAEDLKDTMQSIGEQVITAAEPDVPVLSGALLKSMRAGRSQTKATVRVGGSRIPYTKVIMYGWPAHNIEPHPFLTDALDQEQMQIFTDIEQAINRLLEQANLV